MFFKKAADGSSVYVGGNFNPKVMNLTMDGGGFYDLDHNVNSPPGGMCDGYDSFYNQVNPIDGIFCIKCCKGITECDIPLGISGGCPAQAPGDYTAKIFPQGILPITGRSLSNPGVPQVLQSLLQALVPLSKQTSLWWFLSYYRDSRYWHGG
jgi:hypothetical protein